MSRLQDSVIDDDDDFCPLCVEEFDLGDKNFRPCPCGYQICQFCFNSLKNTYEASKCPNCRRPYDEKTIEYKVPTPEEQRQDQLNKTKRQQAAKRRDVEKREVEASSRRNLAGVRVKQQNLVYVIGLVPQIKDEQSLLQTLRGPEYFGQYGEVEKIVVSKAKPGAVNQGVGVYVTYARKEDAAVCIATIDGKQNGERTLRAQFGTTKYCSAFLRHETCTNKNCSFLHETGEDGQNSSIQGEPHAPKTKQAPMGAAAPPPRPGSTTHSITSQPMVRQGSKDSGSRKDSIDGSALPSTASWAQPIPIAARVRRASQSTSRATPSPQLTHAALASSHKSDKSRDITAIVGPSRTTESTSLPAKMPPSRQNSMPKSGVKRVDPVQLIFDSVLKSVSSREFKFVFSDVSLSDDEKEAISRFPCLIDPYGGAKRRAMQEKDAAERARIESEAKLKLEAQAKSSAEEALEDENMGAGSLALGGEPEHNTRGISARAAIQRPSQTTSGFLNDQFAGMNLRSSSPQQRQHPASVQQAPGLQPPNPNTSFELSNFDRTGPQFSQAQYDQISNHQRHGSRYFNHESKGGSTNRFQAPQQPFYTSGVQGPPPGLPASGTPPVSGGGMFAHGQNFTNPGFGTTKETNADMLARGRSGTTGGPEVSKRGGVEHLADPSIVQARIHQGGAASNSNTQGLFGGQQVDEANFPSLPSQTPAASLGLHSRVTSFHSVPGSSGRSTPRVPPGFENIHVQPADGTPQSTAGAAASKPTHVSAPTVPALPALARAVSANPSTDQLNKDESKPLDKAQAAGVSLDSPKPSQPPLLHRDRMQDVTAVPEKSVKDIVKAAEPMKEKEQFSPIDSTVSKTEDKKPAKPTRIAIPAISAAVAVESASASPAKGSDSDPPATPNTRDAAIVGTAPIMTPRNATPAAAISEVSRASAPRQRTLRVTTSTSVSTKSGEPAPQSATAEKPGPAAAQPHPPLKATSRQGSISSIPKQSLDSASHSRPSTPALSERVFSETVSRASSPPPSIVGAAIERGKTKAQLKKERKEKAKTHQDPSSEPAVASRQTSTALGAEEVGPIVSRQKKQKKKSEPKYDSNTNAKSASARNKDDIAGDVDGSKSSTPVLPSPAPRTPSPLEPYTIRDLYSDLAQMPNYTSTDVQRLLSEHTSPITKILSDLIVSGDLSKDHPWLNPPSFNSQAYRLSHDPRKGQDYLDAHGYTSTSAFGYVYLPIKERRALERGSAVGVAGNPPPAPPSDAKNSRSPQQQEDVLKRTLITPNGVIYRHFTSAESEKVLELEERRDFYIEEFGEDVGGMHALGVRLEDDDAINLEGGMEELSRRGEGKGIIWVRERDGNGDDGGEFYSGDEGLDDDDGDEMDDLGIDVEFEGSVGWDGGDVQQSQHKKGIMDSQRSARGNAVQSVSLRSMDADSLAKRVIDKQKELESAKKEVEKMEKILAKKSREWARWRDSILKT